MTRTRSLIHTLPLALTLGALLLAGCSSPPAPNAAVEPPPPVNLEKFRIQLELGLTLDYQVERKISKVNGKSCYAFITGTLSNQLPQTLGKQTVLDISVMSQGKQLFRDNSNPVTDIAPGERADFVLVQSPVHPDGCPTYDTIKVALRKVLLN